MDDFCRWCGTARRRGDRACQACGRTYGGELTSTRPRTIGAGVLVRVVVVTSTIAVATLLLLGVVGLFARG
jgi:hypothetical protein